MFTKLAMKFNQCSLLVFSEISLIAETVLARAKIHTVLFSSQRRLRSTRSLTPIRRCFSSSMS